MARGESGVIRYLLENDGVITRAEAIALGMAPSTLARRVQTGHLIAIEEGIYVQPGVMDSEHSALLAATRALDAVASHQSAARLHGLDGVDPSVLAVTVPVRRSNRFGDVVVHQLTDLAQAEVEYISGIAVTDIPRTILDLASACSPRTVALVLDQAVRRKKTTYTEVSARLENVARRGKPGVTKLRGILKPRLEGFVASESSLETRLFQLISMSGLPLPEAQFRPPWLKATNGRVDYAYPKERLVVEGDSRAWHGTPEAFQSDRQRDNLAQIAGWRILRFTWNDITRQPSYVVQTIRRALSQHPTYQIRDGQH